jgi:hypothetical protein
MNTRLQKISLLSEMIAFALVDGDLHDKEYDFLKLLAIELDERISHFYKLALLMYCDNLIHKSEDVTIHKIGIKMGLNPVAMNRILDIMKCAPNHIVAPEIIVGAFQEQLN